MERTTFLVLVALAIGTFRALGAPAIIAEREDKAKATFLDRLTLGQTVVLDEKNGRYELGLFPQQIRPLSHTVVEVGQDYVVLRDIVGVTDVVIPIYSIKCIKVLRVGGK